MTQPLLQPYQVYEITQTRPKSDLYAISDRVLAKDVVAIIQTEGPVHADLLYYRMAKLYGIDRAGSDVRRAVDRALREATRAGDVERRKFFYWPAGMNRAEPRTAGPRTVDQIAPEELQDTVLTVLRAAGPMTGEELVRTTARALGFQRTGASLNAGISAAIDALRGMGYIVAAGGSLAAKETDRT
jgi:hypothetical protein